MPEGEGVPGVGEELVIGGGPSHTKEAKTLCPRMLSTAFGSSTKSPKSILIPLPRWTKPCPSSRSWAQNPVSVTVKTSSWRNSCEASQTNASTTGLVSAVKGHVEISGGSIIFSFQVFRLILVLTLLSLSVFSFVQEEEQRIVGFGLNALGKRQGKKGKQKHRYGGPLSDREWLDLASSLTYVRPQQDFLLVLT
jgi:hypothetical protein